MERYFTELLSADLVNSVIGRDLFNTVTGTQISGTVSETESLEDYQALDFEIRDKQGKSAQS